MTNPTINLTPFCRALANHGSVVPHFGQVMASEEISVSHIPHGINLVAIKVSMDCPFGLYIKPKEYPQLKTSNTDSTEAIAYTAYESFSMGNAPKWVDEKSLGRPFNSTGMRFPPYSSHIQLGALHHA